VKKDEVLGSEDPVELLASELSEMIGNDDEFTGACIALVLRDLGLPHDTIIGGEEGEGWDHYLSESDPRYITYWETLSNLIAQIHGQAIASAKFRWGKDFAETHRRAFDTIIDDGRKGRHSA
jgi:hypothetical protein